jgi:hypothetical protein
MPKQEINEDMRQAITALVDAKDPATKGRLMRRVMEGMVSRGQSDADLVDLVFSLDDPRRQTTRAEIATYLAEHPGEWTTSRDDALRKAIASDRSFFRGVSFWKGE